MFTIKGLNTETYIDKRVSGGNCDFTYTDDEFERHVIYGIYCGDMVALTLWQEEGECTSGWTQATFGHWSVVKIDDFPQFTKVPIKELTGDFTFNLSNYYYLDEIDKGVDFKCDDTTIFKVSYDGGDRYYPSGYYDIDDEMFKLA